MRKLPIEYENPIDNLIYELVVFVAPYFKKLNIIPNQITTIGNIFGVIGIYKLYKNFFFTSGLYYFIRYIFDCLDGYYARKYKLVTKFGDYYDHISDIIISIIYIIFMFSKNRLLMRYFSITFIPLFLLMNLHLYYQEHYYKNYIESETLQSINYIIPNSLKPINEQDLQRKLSFSRWFGSGTIITIMILFIIF